MRRLDIPFVRVKKADGTVVEPPSQSVQDLSSPVQRVAPVYTDFRQKHVTVQSFRPGDTLEVSMVTTIHTPLAAGQFWTEYGFNDEAIVLDEQLDIDVPSSRRLTLKLRPGFDPSIKEADGRRLYHWTHAHAVREQDSADKDKEPDTKLSDEPERAPIRLTTFTDWNEVGRWFAGLEQSARQPTPEIREKARELTAGRTTDLEKLEALYDFVSKNFRYVSLSLGVGRYQPRAASDVLREAYGDCKDKHTLLASLIDAAGMQASAALINSRIITSGRFTKRRDAALKPSASMPRGRQAGEVARSRQPVMRVQLAFACRSRQITRAHRGDVRRDRRALRLPQSLPECRPRHQVAGTRDSRGAPAR
jgi:transglutaminase-like putative cysteine protease